jgi:hypothetical protein
MDNKLLCTEIEKIVTGLQYAVTNEIYPPKYSVIRLIGKTGYSHVESFKRKQDAINLIISGNGTYIKTYKHNLP